MALTDIDKGGFNIGKSWAAGLAKGFRRKIIRLCAYEDCEWRGSVDESPYFGKFHDDNLADAEQLAHMFYQHGYPYQPWRYKAMRRAYA